MIGRIIEGIFWKSDVGLANSTTRDSWVKEMLEGLPAGLRIIDAGAGEQQYKKFCTHLEYVAQDFAQYDGQGNSTGLHTGNWVNEGHDIVCDITNIPEPDASFDAVLCTEVFEHLPNPVLAIEEFSRLLKPGGHLIMTAPFCSLTHFAPFHFYTGFNRYFYEKHLADNGFELREIVANGNYFEYMAQELRRIDDVAQKYANSKVGFLQKVSIGLLLGMLKRMSAKDAGSSELLHFDYQVYAVKK